MYCAAQLVCIDTSVAARGSLLRYLRRCLSKSRSASPSLPPPFFLPFFFLLHIFVSGDQMHSELRNYVSEREQTGPNGQASGQGPAPSEGAGNGKRG